MRKIYLCFLLALSVGFSVGAQSLERESFLDAESRFLSKNYPLALERYDEFLRSWPDSQYSGDARYRRSVSLYRLGRAQEAYDALSLVEARYRGTKYIEYAPFWKAVIEYDRGEYGKAAERFGLLAKNPPDTESLRQSLLYLGKANSALDRQADAKAAFERLIGSIEKPEDEPSALIFLFDIYSKEGDSPRIVALWEKLDPAKLDVITRERVSLRAAESYAALGKGTEAVALFESLSSSPRRDIAVSSLQRLFIEARRSGDEARVSAAMVKAENALRASPELLSEFWLRVGAGAFKDGRMDLARSYFLRIAALLRPEKVDPDVPIYLAEIAAREGNIAEAVSTLTAAAPFAGTREALLKTRLGWYSLRLEKWADARKVLTEALGAASKGTPEIERATRSYLTYALYRTAEMDLGLTALDGANALALPGMERLRAELLRKAGRAAESLEAFEELIVSAAKSGPAVALEPRVAQLSLFFENGRFERVVASSEALYRDFPDTARMDADLRAAAGYLSGVSYAAVGKFALALTRLDDARTSGAARLGTAAPWAAYYRAWSLYRLARFAEAKTAFDAFLKEAPAHPRAYSAAYLSAWCSANTGDYSAAVASARKAVDYASATPPGLPAGSDAAVFLSRAAFLEATFRVPLKDWDGAIAAYDKAAAAKSAQQPSGLTPYTVKAQFERATVLELADRIDQADQAFAALARAYPDDPLAQEAAYRRGELMFRAKRWAPAAERFASYRDAYRSGERLDGALYFGALALSSSGKVDAGILLWERLLGDLKTSRYRFAASFAVARAYREKKDWEAAFRAYTSAIAEFGDQARKAGAADEADVLRYLMTGISEKAARLHVVLTKEGGAATAVGRSAALELARFYIRESAQREAGLSLLDEIIAARADDPIPAAEAAFLKGDYYGLVGVDAYDRAALAYLDAVGYAASVAADAKTSAGVSVRAEFVPEALFRSAAMRVKAGKKESAAEVLATLVKNYPSSTWTVQARRLVEGNR
ncbi:MAG: tetratricopeptide repeat protein [Treponemataceae bacterium]